MAFSDSTLTRTRTTKHEFFKAEFDRLATDGVIGHPDGAPAFAYIRVSSDEQGEEGRAGLPRQVEHVHEKALESGYRITWDRLFADDFTGFELERPALDRLRTEYRNSERRRACAVVMEDIDRLSRDADWHQGFLLKEMRQAGVEAIFWESMSPLERKIRGIIAQEAMQQAKKRMQDAVIRKARDGRVTARTPSYGYRFVDSKGNEGEKAKSETFYAIQDGEAQIVQQIFKRIASGETLNGMAAALTSSGVKTPQGMENWRASTVRAIIVSEVYKGEYIAHRWIVEKASVRDTNGVSRYREVTRKLRPENEWIRVPVPPIVDAGLWQAANDMLAKNKLTAARNSHERYLLTGLVKCAECGRSCSGRKTPSKTKAPYLSYACNLHQKPKHIRDQKSCSQGYIGAPILEPAVWGVVSNALLEPQVLIKALEDDALNEQSAQLEHQIEYVESLIEENAREDEKHYRAYMAGAFDETEYAELRKQTKSESAKLSATLENLRAQRVDKEELEAQKALILNFAERLRAMNAHAEPPFELKQRILRMLLDRIVVDTRERWFRLEGTIHGHYAIENTPISRGQR